MPTKFSAEVKAQALAYLQNGLTIQEAADKMSVSPQTISNWKKENGGGDKEAGATKKRSRKPKRSGKSVEQQLEEYALGSQLDQLENRYLRLLVNQPDKDKRQVIHIEYLYERLKLWGDELVKPLVAAPEEPEA